MQADYKMFKKNLQENFENLNDEDIVSLSGERMQEIEKEVYKMVSTPIWGNLAVACNSLHVFHGELKAIMNDFYVMKCTAIKPCVTQCLAGLPL